jgi:small GTP-binding protein
MERRRIPLPEKIKELEKELSTTKYNKKTQHAIGLLKAKIARLKEEYTKKSKVRKGEGYIIKKSGDGTVIILGFPSVGKSTLLNKLTNAKSEIGCYEFTTLKVVPGLMKYNGAKIQILDVPGVIRGASSGKGRGKEVLACVNNADVVIFLVDVKTADKLSVLKKEVYNFNIRINSEKPDIKIAKKQKGGITITSLVKTKELNKDLIKDILKEFKIHNADITIREDVSVEQFIDVIEGNKKYVPGIVVLNKIDVVSDEILNRIKNKFDICISAEKGTNIEVLKKLIFEKLELINVYCKEKGKEADMDEPLIMKKNSSLRDMCFKIHKDFVNKFRFARIWGESVKHSGQKVFNLNHKLKDKDVVELHV